MFSGINIVTRVKYIFLSRIKDLYESHHFHFLVMRPDDERLVRYPKEFITDAHLLPPRKVEPDFNTPHPIRFSNVVFHNDKP